MSKDIKNNASTRTPLSKERVIEAAVIMADEGGIEALSMRKLGLVLGVEAMALYYHFANKEALIDGMVDSVHAEVDVPQDTDEWSISMRRRAVSALHALERHRWAAPLIEGRNNPGRASMELIDATVKCLRRAGFSVDMVAHAISVLDAYTFGFAQQLRAEETVEQSAQMGADIMTHFPFDAYPYVGEFISGHVIKSGYRTMDEFEFGLDLIIEGLRRLELAKRDGR